MTGTFTFKDTTTFKEYLAIFYYQTFRKKIVKTIFFFVVIVSILSAILEIAMAENVNWYRVIFSLLIVPVFLVVFVYVTGFLITILLWKFKPAIFNATNPFTHW